MSTIADVLPDDAAAAAAAASDEVSRPAATPRFAFFRKNVWALGDQALISGTNFATGVLTARALDQGEFGTFSIIYAALLLANTLQSALVTQAHNVIGTTLRGEDYRRYTSSSAVSQLLMCAAELLIAVPLAVIGHAKGWDSAAMLLALVPAIVFWQLQEFVRRVLYTEGRYSGAFFNDMVSYGGQAAVLAVLFAAKHLHGWRFDGAVALYALAATSAAAALLGLWQLRHSLARHLDREAFGENWHFGKWLLGGELMQWCSSIHMQVWWAALLIGAWASADLRAAQILFGPTRVIGFFLCTVLPIRFARTLHDEGPAAMHAQLRHVLGWLIPMAGGYCALLVMFPRPLLHLVYGKGYESGEAVRVLMLYSMSAFLSYLQMVIAAALTASRQTRSMFAGNACACAVALAMSPVCIKLFGASGAIVSMIVTTLVTTLMFAWAYRKRSRAAGAAGFEVVRRAGSCVSQGSVEEPV